MLEFYMAGVACDPPENWAEFEIELSWEDDTPTASCRVNSFDFVGSNAWFINDWIWRGTVGGPGIYEGIPFRIKACGGIVVFDGVLDLTHAGNKFDCDRVTCFIREGSRIDWLNDVADSFTFAYLASSQVTGTAHITSSDYVKIPYVISTLPNYTQLAMLGVSTFVVIRELKKILFYEMPSLFVNIGAAFTVPTTWNIVVSLIAQLVSLIAYIIILCVMLVKLVNQLLDSVCQPDKYKYGMKVKTLFEKACAHLGLAFQSSILNTAPFNELTIIPQKYVIEDPTKNRSLPFDEGIKSWLSPATEYNAKAYGYYDGTFGGLIREMNSVFNAKIRVQSDILSFEVVNTYTMSQYKLPDVVDLPNGTNASELASNYYLEFITDSEEINTYDKYDKTNAQCIFRPVVINNSKNILLKNLKSITINYAMAKRKKDYTAIEQTFNEFFTTFYGLIDDLSNAINEIIGGLASILNAVGLNVTYDPIVIPQPTFGTRVGYMLLETDFIGVQKLLITNKNGLIPNSNITYVNAEYLLKNYHNRSFIVDSAIDPSTNLQYNNQFWRYTDVEVPFCCSDYVAMMSKNWIKTFNGDKAKAKKLIWSPEKLEARIDYDVKKQYTKNIKQTYVVDGVEL